MSTVGRPPAVVLPITTQPVEPSMMMIPRVTWGLEADVVCGEVDAAHGGAPRDERDRRLGCPAGPSAPRCAGEVVAGEAHGGPRGGDIQGCWHVLGSGDGPALRV